MRKFGNPILALLSLAVTATAGDIRFEGNRAASNEALNNIEIRLAEREGELTPAPDGMVRRLGDLDASRLSEDAVRQVVRAVSGYYQSRNILATRAEVTRESYETARNGGDLVIQISEGRVDAVRVSGGNGEEVSPATRERLLAVSSVQPGGSLDGRALEHSLALINRFSVNQVQPVLFASTEGTVLEYRVRQDKGWNVGYSADNYGSERTGEVRHHLDAGVSSIFGEDDRVSIAGIITSSGDSRYIRGDYFTPFGRMHQHRVRASVYHAGYTAEEIGIGAFDFEGESNGLILAYETTLWSETGRFLDLSAGAHYVEASQDQSSVGIGSASTTFLLPFIDLKLSQQSPSTSWVAGVRLETNLADLGGTDASELAPLGRLNANDEFVIGRFYGGLRVFLDGVQRTHEVLANGAYLSSLSGDRLPASFLNVVGGHSTVRGYRVAAVSGDTSAYAQLEYRFHALRVLEPTSRWDVAVGLFYDIGMAENEDRLAFEVDDTISSYGVGLHVSLGPTFRASVEYARAAQDLITPYDATEAGDDEVYFKGSIRF